MKTTKFALLVFLSITSAALAQTGADVVTQAGGAPGGNEQTPLTGAGEALVAFESYRKALETPAATDLDTDAAIRSISAVQGELISTGVSRFEAQQFEHAFLSLQASLQAHDILTAHNKISALAQPDDHAQTVLYTAMSAQLSGRNADAMKYYGDLYEKGNAVAAVYEALNALRSQAGDEAGAMKVLEEGRAKYPDDAQLLFAEINVLLKAGRLDELTDRLKQAIESEPNNVSVYVTLGAVYDQLYQAMLKENNAAKAAEYFEETKKYYLQAAAREPTNLDATYSLGALYFGKAALLTQALNAMVEDSLRFRAMKAEVMGYFDQALPYLRKAESIDPNHILTLIALAQIYERKEDPLSMQLRHRLEVLHGGGKNATSLFKE